MPRPRKPPRLARKRERSGAVYWVIRDRERWHPTGCLENDLEGADRALTAYKAKKYEPAGINQPSAVPIADALLLYARDKGPDNKRPNEFRAMMERLDAFWGDRMIAAIRGATCREYARQRGAKIAARNELSMLRAAVNHYHAEHTLDAVPKITLPAANPPRMRWLRREEAARLLDAARKARQKFKGEVTRRPTARHLVRFNLIGLYTGTRSGAILSLYWMPNTIGGYADLERGVLHRRAVGEGQSNKQKPPVRIPSRLLAHLRRWKRMDDRLPARLDANGSPLPRPIVHWNGEPATKINKAYRSIVAAAGLDKDVTPHVLRHTRATWLMQAGVDKYEAAGSLGMTVEILESVYGHHHPDFQKGAAEAY